jgi:hypothetical protein
MIRDIATIVAYGLVFWGGVSLVAVALYAIAAHRRRDGR